MEGKEKAYVSQPAPSAAPHQGSPDFQVGAKKKDQNKLK